MDYEITFDTQVILPVENNSSRIIENNESYVINVPPMQVLEHSCEYFGSSFNGRKEGTKKLLGITHKSPIIVEESRKIIFRQIESIVYGSILRRSINIINHLLKNLLLNLKTVILLNLMYQ